MDHNARSFSRLLAASNQRKPLALDNELVELSWHNGNVVAQSQTLQKPLAPAAAGGAGERGQNSEPRLVPDANLNPSTSGITGEETTPWFEYGLDDDTMEKDLYAQLFYHIANADGVVVDGGVFAGSGSQPPPALHTADLRGDHVANFAHFARSPESTIGSSGTGECSSMARIGSSFCGSNQVQATLPEPSHIMSNDVFDAATEDAENSTLPSEALHTGTHDGTATSSSGGSGSNFGGSGLPSMSTHINKRKGRREDSDSRSEDLEYEAVEETTPSRRFVSKRRSRAAEVHNLSERRRRDRINEKMRALQELIPHCNKTDKASILDEAIEYLKSLQMQLQIMWMTTGVAPMMFPGAHQFMSQMAMGVNPACMPAMQSLNQLPRVPYMNHRLSANLVANQMPPCSSPAMNASNVANQMQNVRLGESSNHFLHPNHAQTAGSQAPGLYAYGPQLAQRNQVSTVPASTVVPTSRAGLASSSDGI